MALRNVSDKNPNGEGIPSERVSVEGQLSPSEANGW
jgi:hypothetical protein